MRQIPGISSLLPICDLIFYYSTFTFLWTSGHWYPYPTRSLRSHLRHRSDYLLTGGSQNRHGNLIRPFFFFPLFKCLSFPFSASRGRACSKSGGKGWYPDGQPQQLYDHGAPFGDPFGDHYEQHQENTLEAASLTDTATPLEISNFSSSVSSFQHSRSRFAVKFSSSTASRPLSES